MATIKDVAFKAGVSISTVSNVINGTKYVSPEITERVNLAVKALGYRANMFGRSLKNQRSRQIGLVVLDMCGLFFPYIIREICRIAAEHGYTVTLLDSNGNFEKEKEAIYTLVDNCVDGIILSSTVGTAEKESYAQQLKEILHINNRPIPLVMLERDFSSYGIDSIIRDTYGGACLAMEHLIRRGCKHIAHISVPSGKGGRHSAYCDTLQKYGIPYDERYDIPGDFSHDGGYTAINRLLNLGLPVDGIFVANDQMCIGVIHALTEHGIVLPDQIKIVGFDNVFICDAVCPTLTTVDIDKVALAQKSIALLLDRIKNGMAEKPYSETLTGKLIIRDSA